MSTPRTSTPTNRTRTVRRVALPALAVVGALGASFPAAGASPAITCGAVVTSDVRLTADLVDCPGSGLVIGAPGITVDLAGHTIDGTGSGAGIDNEAGHDGVRVTRGTLREFVFGVNLFEADGTRLERLTAVGNLDGFKIGSSVDVELDRITAADNVGPGIEITFSDEVTVRRSIAADNGLGGIVDRFSDRSRHLGNSLVGNTGPGLTLNRTGAAVVERNHVAANDSVGIELVGVEDADLDRNDAISNAGDGISVDAAGNRISRTRAAFNGGGGIVAPAGTIDGGRNRATGNVGVDCTGVVCR